eukprot:CAMPEP_0172709756 /NCGR_PEP_ID=MMETSP1074-20121228/55252_1 /TAXON_ID=2916 /ORGANISM="Ceratium fusus, Strain PA161109" /LENGTH=282 /DNA_ID=CAMNT_0013533061 /DNA_START=479 /DNA_END=1328 /DNA_ORIENTATION=+
MAAKCVGLDSGGALAWLDPPEIHLAIPTNAVHHHLHAAEQVWACTKHKEHGDENLASGRVRAFKRSSLIAREALQNSLQPSKSCGKLLLPEGAARCHGFASPDGSQLDSGAALPNILEPILWRRKPLGIDRYLALRNGTTSSAKGSVFLADRHEPLRDSCGDASRTDCCAKSGSGATEGPPAELPLAPLASQLVAELEATAGPEVANGIGGSPSFVEDATTLFSGLSGATGTFRHDSSRACCCMGSGASAVPRVTALSDAGQSAVAFLQFRSSGTLMLIMAA